MSFIYEFSWYRTFKKQTFLYYGITNPRKFYLDVVETWASLIMALTKFFFTSPTLYNGFCVMDNCRYFSLQEGRNMFF
jgi:hypothetical protein